MDIEKLLTDLGDVAMSGTTSDHDKAVIDEAMKSLRLVPKLMKVVEAARGVIPEIDRMPNYTAGRCERMHADNITRALKAALAALDAGERHGTIGQPKE